VDTISTTRCGHRSPQTINELRRTPARVSTDDQALKKIINSYAAGRPASDASLLSLGQRPAKRTLSSQSDVSTSDPSFSLDAEPGSEGHVDEFDSSLALPTHTTLSASHLPPSDTDLRSQGSADLDPLPPETEPPAPSRGTIMDREGSGSSGKNDSFKAHRDVFFFTLQRELEKVRLGVPPAYYVERRC
jgi:CDK inhibitor PHO81